MSGHRKAGFFHGRGKCDASFYYRAFSIARGVAKTASGLAFV